MGEAKRKREAAQRSASQAAEGGRLTNEAEPRSLLDLPPSREPTIDEIEASANALCAIEPIDVADAQRRSAESDASHERRPDPYRRQRMSAVTVMLLAMTGLQADAEPRRR